MQCFKPFLPQLNQKTFLFKKHIPVTESDPLSMGKADIFLYILFECIAVSMFTQVIVNLLFYFTVLIRHLKNMQHLGRLAERHSGHP